MYEAFVVISRELSNKDSQLQLLHYLLQKPKSDWQNSNLAQVVGDPSLLLKMVGIIPEPNQQQAQALYQVYFPLSLLCLQPIHR
jgi:hypothetical protein